MSKETIDGAGITAQTPADSQAPAEKRIEILEKLVNKQSEMLKELTEKVKAVPATSVDIAVKDDKKTPAIFKEGSKVYDIIMPKFQATNKEGMLELVDLRELKDAEIKVWLAKMPHAFRERK